MEIQIPAALKKIAELSQFDVYITGGYLRNHFAGLGETDIDLAGPLVATALGLPKNYIVRVVNFRLGTSVIKIGSEEYEYTPFRIESYGAGGRHTPVTVAFTSDIAKDAARRDFACNSLYYNLKTGELVDLYGGKKDSENKILRNPDPERIFADDGLRLMRLVRIAAETGFKIEAATAKAAIANASLLADISPERKRVELNRILMADTKYGVAGGHYRGLKLLHQFGLLQYVVPQLCEGEGVAQNPLYHRYDVLEHAFQTVRYAVPDLSVRLAALLHDVGKPYCVKKFGNMHGHETASEHMSRIIMGKFGLRYSNAEIDEVARLTLHHMYDLAGNTSEHKMRLFAAANFDIVDKLAALILADRKGSGMREAPGVHRLTTVKEKMLSDGAPIQMQQMAINGGDLLSLGIRGEAIGIILRDMQEKCILEPRLNNREWLMEYARRRAPK
ncbi:MAG: HD domain-containing protein [Firmicutes bacterium]|nr:HD domain-containing protein [Bacillota bacterium]